MWAWSVLANVGIAAGNTISILAGILYQHSLEVKPVAQVVLQTEPETPYNTGSFSTTRIKDHGNNCALQFAAPLDAQNRRVSREARIV